MVPALLLVLGCWQPDAYEPPPPPAADDEVDEAAVRAAPGEDAAPTEADPAGDEAPPEGAPPAEGEPTAEGEAEPEGDEAPAFPAYAAVTVQAPITIVDDYGKPLAVLGVPGVALEVRGEEAIRTRVWCATCAPPVEGWIQAHLVAPASASPTGGSK